MFAELLSEGGLSFDRLQSFCLVAEAGGVTKAAKGDPNRQSLFSRQIKELEEFFGTELLRRKGRGVVLTSAGERLNVIAREYFASLSDLKAECAQLPVEVVVGAGDSVIRWVLMPQLMKVQAALPKAKLKFLNLTTDEIVRRLSDGVIDFGILRKGAASRPLQSDSLGKMEYALFVPAGVSGANDSIRVLDGLDVATLEGDGSFRRELAAVARKNRLHLNIRLECSSFPEVANAVARSRMAAILPTAARVELAGPGITELKPAALKGLGREMCLAWNPRLLKVRTALVQACGVFARVFRF